jgi:Glycosyltransferase family 92
MSQAPPRPPFLSRVREQWAKDARERALWRRITKLDLHLAQEVTASLPSQPVKLACVVVARGADDSLIAWLEFHRAMGVEHFFVYDRGVQPSTAALLRPYIDTKLVTHLPFPDLGWPEPHSQREVAYAHCVLRFLDHAQYLAKLDVDDFLSPAQPQHATVVEVLSELDRASVCGLEVPRLAAEPPHNFKSVGNTAFLERSLRAGDPHTFAYRVPVPLRLIRGFQPTLHRGAEAGALLQIGPLPSRGRHGNSGPDAPDQAR